jgi:gliding motility-associated-like protein
MNVEVREWRNGQVVNSVRREFEVMIGACEPRPTAEIIAEFDCATNTVLFYPSEPDGEVGWNFVGPGTFTGSADTLYWDPEQNDTADAVVDFEFYLQSSACSIRDTLDYRFIPTPDFEVFGPDSLCQEENGEFYIWVDGQYQQVAWIVENDTVSAIDDYSGSFSDVGNVQIQYFLQLGECSFSSALDVYVQNCNEIQFPNVFTPNGDGMNDFWTPLPGYRVSQLEIVIYNRWGRVVWESRAAGDVAWDGTNINNGKPCSEGTYYYVYKADVPRNPRGQGFITLMRE